MQHGSSLSVSCIFQPTRAIMHSAATMIPKRKVPLVGGGMGGGVEGYHQVGLYHTVQQSSIVMI